MQRPPRLDQFVAGYTDGDAISREARAIRDHARDAGFLSDIFAPHDRIGPAVRDDCRPLSSARPTSSDIVLLHYAVASPADDAFRAAPGKRILRYHNITPGRFFRGFDDALAHRLDAARKALPSIIAAAHRSVACSQFNADELTDAGATDVSVVPLFFPVQELNRIPDPAMLSHLDGPLANILFVGRLAPNKAIEDLILAAAWIRHCIGPVVRLVVTGPDNACQRYTAMLRATAARLAFPDLWFTGFLSPQQLAACYRGASLFATASRHEGFCLPLLEAVWHGLPVIARACGGMPEALDGAGVLFDHLSPMQLGELIHRAVTDPALRRSILDSQAPRRDRLQADDPAARFHDLITDPE